MAGKGRIDQKSVEFDEISELLSYSNRSNEYESEISQLIRSNSYEDEYDCSLFDTAKEEQFVRKLDFFLLSWGCVSYCIKNIDASNYKNAYVSGMKEDLNMVGNQYNLLGTFFTIGYAISAIPCQMTMSRVKASYFMGSCELLWGICTCLCAFPTTARGLYPLRFLIGIFEASSWSGMMVIFFNYYNNEELGFRAGVLGASAFVGQIFTLFLQAAIYNRFGNSQFKSWQWLFIINGIMTIAVSIVGFYFLPDTPANGGARWMNRSEIKIALRRVEKLGRVTVRRFELNQFFKAFSDHKVYYLLLAYMPWDLGLNVTSYITLWLKSIVKEDKSPRYTVQQVNLIPIIGFIIAATSMVVITKFADITQKKIHVMVFQQVCGIFGCTILSIWPSSLYLKFAGFFIMYSVQSTGAIIMSLVPEIWAKEPEIRAVITAIIVVLDYATNSWLPLVIFPAETAPIYKYGYKVSLALETASLVGCLVFYYHIYSKLNPNPRLACQLSAIA